MIKGAVNSELEAFVRLHIADANGQTQPVDLKIDTGFTDFIALPASMVASLGLPLDTFEAVQTADGSVVRVPVHTGEVIWDGRSRQSISTHSAQTKLSAWHCSQVMT